MSADSKKKKTEIKHLPGHTTTSDDFGFEKYTQLASEYRQPEMIALNRRFPNLVGFGVVQHLKQLMAENPRGKVRWMPEDIRKLSYQMNTDESVIRDVVDFCRKELGIFRLTKSYFEFWNEDIFYLIYPEFMNNLIDIQIKRMTDEVYSEANIRVDEKGVPSKSTTASIKKKAVDEMKAFLVIDDTLKDKIRMYYPGLGEPDALWKEFMRDIDKSYMKWHQILTPENYRESLFIWLNNHKPSRLELDGGEL